MAAINVQQASVPALNPIVFAPCSAGGDTCRVNGITVLIVHNAAAGPATVTVVVPGSRFGQQNPDIPVVVAAGAEAIIPLLPDFKDTVDGLVDITYSSVVTLTIAAVRL